MLPKRNFEPWELQSLRVYSDELFLLNIYQKRSQDPLPVLPPLPPQTSKTDTIVLSGSTKKYDVGPEDLTWSPGVRKAASEVLEHPATVRIGGGLKLMAAA